MAALRIEMWINLILQVLILGVTLWAFVDCLMRRTDAFPAIGTMPKIGWLLIFLLMIVLVYFGGFGLFAMIGAGLAAYYLLDVRRGLREAAEGPW